MNHSPGEEMEYILKQIWRSSCENQTLLGRQKGKRQGLAAEVVSVKEKRAGGISVEYTLTSLLKRKTRTHAEPFFFFFFFKKFLLEYS